MTKQCSECQKTKLLEDFHAKHTSKDGLDTRCKECRQMSQRKDRNSRLAHYLWKTAKSRAKRSGLDFNIQSEDVIIPETCPIMGIPLFVCAGKKWGKNSPSIDRIDNKQGYIKGNVAVISMQANNMKSNLDIEDIELISQCMERFVKYLKKEI